MPRPPRTPDSSVPPTPFSDERFTVEAVERQVRSRSRHREYTTNRSRREQQREANGLDKYVWFAVAAIAVLYLGFLAFSVIRPSAKPVPAVKPAPAVVETPAPVETPEEPPAVIPENSPSFLMLEETVASLKRSDILYKEAKRLVRDRRYEEADAKFAEAAVLTPGRFVILFEWAESLREQKRWAASRDQLLKAVAIEPDSIPARLALALCSYQLKLMPDALALANWVLESEPYSEPANQIAADVLSSMERYEAAIIHLQKLVALNSLNHVAENNLGTAYLRLRQYNQAIGTFENVIKDEPGNSQAYYYLALCYVQRNNPDLAMEVLVRASTQFGREFVMTWTSSPEFASLQSQPDFNQHFGAAP